MADIKGLWVTVGNREYYTSDLASVNVDMYAGESLEVTGIDYELSDAYTPEHGVIAFESYVRREHGAAEIGSYDYTDGRFGDPVEAEPSAGQAVSHPGLNGGWELDVIDNRIAVVAIRYFGDESAIEDRMFIDVNVDVPDENSRWTESIVSVQGDWETDEEGGVAGDSSDGDKNTAGLTVIDTGSQGSQRYEIGVKAKTVEENTYANGFVVVDYRGENDFVYAGLRSIADKWVIGHFNGKFNDLASLKQDVQPRQVYDLRVAVDGSNVALAVDGVLRVSHEFDRPLDEGAVGLANQYAYTHFSGFNYFDNAPASDDGSVNVENGADGTVFTFGDGNDWVAAARDAYDQAIENVEAARMARDEAEAFAGHAEQRHDELESLARSLDDAAEQAKRAAADAAAAHDQMLRETESTQQQVDQSGDAIEEAQADYDAASDRLSDASKAVKELEHDLNKISGEADQAQKNVEKHQSQVDELQDAAEEAAQESEQLAVAALVARRAADFAEAIAERAEDAPKDIRKAAEKAAKEADKAADKAEQKAEKAEEDAEEAAEELEEAQERLEEASDKADNVAGETDQVTHELDRARQTLDDAHATLHEAEATVGNRQDARDELLERIEELRHLAQQRADEAADALERAERSARESSDVRREAEQAGREAQAAREKANQLANALESAQEELHAAELALQEAMTSPPQPVLPIDPSGDGEQENDDSHVYSLNFNHQDDGAFETVSGNTNLVAGQLHLAGPKDVFAISVLDDAALPERSATRMYATVRADELPGKYQNGFIIFDYESPEDFKYAGGWAGADRWAIGEVVDGERTDLEVLDEVIGQGPAYELQVWLRDGEVTLLVEGVQKVQHQFDQPIDDGQLGVGNLNANSRFDQVAVMQLHGGTGDIGIEEIISDSTIDPASNDAAINEMF